MANERPSLLTRIGNGLQKLSRRFSGRIESSSPIVGKENHKNGTTTQDDSSLSAEYDELPNDLRLKLNIPERSDGSLSAEYDVLTPRTEKHRRKWTDMNSEEKAQARLHPHRSQGDIGDGTDSQESEKSHVEELEAKKRANAENLLNK